MSDDIWVVDLVWNRISSVNHVLRTTYLTERPVRKSKWLLKLKI